MARYPAGKSLIRLKEPEKVIRATLTCVRCNKPFGAEFYHSINICDPCRGENYNQSPDVYLAARNRRE